jgi:hypothetical protein
MLEQCLAAAGSDPQARAACAAHERALAGETRLASAVDACVAAQCSAACGLTCGSLYQITEPAAAAACQACIVEGGGCKAAQDCAGNADCQEYFNCRAACVTGDCVAACDLDNPVGRALQHTFHQAADGQCRSACEVGGNWSCVGSVMWPAVQGTGRSLTVTFSHLTSGTHVGAGLTVKLCELADPDCVAPINDQVQETDSAGSVTVIGAARDEDHPGLGLTGYLDVSGSAVGDSPIVPALVYWGFPTVEENAVILPMIPLVSDAEAALIYGSAGVTRDPQRGTVGIGVLDCYGIQASGVTLTATGVDDSTQLIYLHDTAAAGSSLFGDGPTQSTGAALFLNVPPGTVTVTATPDVIGRAAGSISVTVRPGSYTVAGLSPTPDP